MTFCTIYLILAAWCSVVYAVWADGAAQQAAARLLQDVFTINGVILAVGIVSVCKRLESIQGEIKSGKKDLK